MSLYVNCRLNDADIKVIFTRHYCAETAGLQVLRIKVQSKFGVETVFLDMPTGL